MSYKVKMSPYQRLSYISWKLNPERYDLNIVLDQEMHGILDIERLNHSIARFTADYLIFNSHIIHEDNGLFWIPNTSLGKLDYFKNPLTSAEMLNYAKQPFNLEQGPLYRFALIQLDKQTYRFIIVLHHLLIDGLSGDEAYQALSNYYNDENFKEKTTLSEQEQAYSRVTAKFNQDIKIHKDEYKKFWHTKLANIKKLDLSFLKNNGNKDTNLLTGNPVGEVRIDFDKEILNKVSQIKRRYKITPYLYSKAIYALLLYKLSGQAKFCISYPFALREAVGFIYGAHTNANVIPFDFSSLDTTIDLLEYIKDFTKSLKQDGINYAYSPTEDVLLVSNKDLFNISFAATNFKEHGFHFNDCPLVKINHELNIDRVNDLVMGFSLQEDKICIIAQYKRDILDTNLVEQFVKAYAQLYTDALDQLLSGEKTPLPIKFLDQSYTNLAKNPAYLNGGNLDITGDYNNLADFLIAGKDVSHKYFRFVDLDIETSYSYKEFILLSYKMANLLQQSGINPKEYAVLQIESKELFTLTFWACILCGIIPVILSVPEEWAETNPKVNKLKTILTVLDKAHIICEENSLSQAKLIFKDTNCLSISAYTSYKSEYKKYKANKEDPALLSFTSGSTGIPKAVSLTHQNLISVTLGIIQQNNLPDDYIFLSWMPVDHVANVVFLNLIPTYLKTTQIHINDIKVFTEPSSCFKYLAKYRANVSWMLNFMFELFLHEKDPLAKEIDLSCVKFIINGGEKINQLTLDKALEKLKVNGLLADSIYPAWGMTETSSGVLFHKYDGQLNSFGVSLGEPIPGAEVRIVDDQHQLVAMGQPGYLEIRGLSVIKSYLNNPKANEESFRDAWFVTGDVAVIHENNVYFINRDKDDIMINGRNIALSEIETVLNKLPQVLAPYSIGLNLILNNQANQNDEETLVLCMVLKDNLNLKDIFSVIQQTLIENLGVVANTIYQIQIADIPRNAIGKVLKKQLLNQIKNGQLTYLEKIDNKTAFLLKDQKSITPESITDKELKSLTKTIMTIWQEMLNIKTIGINQPFFSIGGNSIKLLQLRAKLNTIFDLQISIVDLFKNNSIIQIANLIKLHNIELKTGNQSKINNLPIQNISRTNLKIEEQKLSYAQERLWFIDQYEGGTNAYNIPLVYKLSNRININFLSQSIDQVIARHEILHSLIKDKDGIIYQVVVDLNELPFKIKQYKLSTPEKFHQTLEEEANYIFRLDQEYPIKVTFYQVGDEDHYLSIVIHHSAFDGWSADVFLRDLYHYYQALDNPENNKYTKSELPELTVQYKDFAVWQREYLAHDLIEEQFNYWKNKLANYELLNLPKDYSRSQKVSYAGNDVYFELDALTSNKLRELAKELNVSLSGVLLSAYYLLLSTYSGQKDIIIGVPVANRHYSQLENTIGFFVNNLVLRLQIIDTDSLFEFIEKVSLELMNGQVNQDLPFMKLIDMLELPKNMSYHPLFQVMFSVQSFGNTNPEVLELLQPYQNNAYKIARFDITTLIDDSQPGITGSFNYATNLFKEETINGFIKTYKIILTQLATNASSTKVRDIYYLDKNTYQEIIYNWNNTEKAYPRNKTIHQLFEEQVLKTPDNIAVIYENKQLSYQELNQKSNQLAHYLRTNYQIQGDDLVALCLDRSEYMLISILGILKAGGAYVPLDPSYPEERIHYILNDTRAKVVITSLNYADTIFTFKVNKPENEILSIDSKEVRNILAKQPNVNPEASITSNNLAYVIYTSGTTGKPKGAMLEHGGIVNRITWMNEEYPLNINDRILQKTPYVFDVSVWELFWANWYGAGIVFAKPDGHKDADYLVDLIAQQDISVIHFVPSMLDVFNQYLEAQSNYKLDSLRYIFCSGEALSIHQVKQTQKLLDKVQIHNLYGPTEASVDVLYYDCSDKNIEQVYIGKPIKNTAVYVLDNNVQILPAGAVGELYIGGVGLARGYLNRPDLTRERFISNPFQSEAEKQQNINGRIYKTGDLVRWLPDGNIEYIGRNDFQVKIRGFRIELGEIESRLGSYPGVKQSVVIVKQHKDSSAAETENKYLVGYYVAESKLAEEQILDYLSQYLPQYMVPNILVHLDKLPLTINGKLDRQALPEPEFTDENNYVAPRNELEQKICTICAEVLGLPAAKIGMRDDFFSLGGNSISAIILVNKLNKDLGLDDRLKIMSIFNYSSIEKLAAYLATEELTTVRITKQAVAKAEEQLLSFAQERIWFIEKYTEGTNAYNIPLTFKLNHEVNLSLLEKSIQLLVNRHEVLKSLIKQDANGQPYQVVGADEILVSHFEVKDKAELNTLLEAEANYVFDLSCEYPFKARLYHNVATTDNYLGFLIHHIAFDGWSVNVLLRDLSAYYMQYLNESSGNADTLPLNELAFQYQDFALWQRNYLSGEVLAKQVDYWKTKLAGYETLNLLTDKPRPLAIDYHGEDIFFDLNEELSNQLRGLAKQLNVSLYSLLLSAYDLMLGIYANQDDIVVGTPVANRDYSGLDEQIGLFLNTLVLRVKLDSSQNLKDYIQEVGRSVIEAQSHQELPFEKLIDELNLARDNQRSPLFQVMFVVQSFGMSEYNRNEQLRELITGYVDSSEVYKVAKFDLTTTLDDSNPAIKGCFNYKTSLFTAATIKGYINTYAEILRQFGELNVSKTAAATIKIKDIKYLDKDNYKKIVYDWNNTNQDYPIDKTIHHLFEEQVSKTPDNIAVVHEDKYLTYRELNQRANQLAHYLKNNYQINGDDLIALCLDRSEHMLISILATLKAGAAYVPIDPGFPVERMKYILEDTRARVLLTNEIYCSAIPEQVECHILAIDTQELQEILLTQATTNLGIVTKATDLAYVIYTSGTTGVPKGVMIEHLSYVITLNSIKELYFKPGVFNTYSITNYVFDIFGLEYGLPLLNGGTVELGNVNFENLDCENYNFIQMTPSLCELKLDQLNNTDYLKLLVGGESLNYSLLSRILNKHIDVINVYGPTETTIWSAAKLYSKHEKPEKVSIGRPLGNEKVYILDKNLSAIPIGATGELYIGGSGLGRGYLNKPDLTQEKFIFNPFQTTEEKKLNQNSRLYKTGDLVRYLPDGDLEYIERTDFQVKLHGFRIELTEIETVLLNYPEIKQSVVLVYEQANSEENKVANKYLVAYYVAAHELNETEVLNYLTKYLPDYMLPNSLIYLPELPLTINGKLDRKALPSPVSIAEFSPPTNQEEQELANLFAEVLGIDKDKIGINDSFFQLGGNSLLAVKLTTAINNYYTSHLKIADIFVYKTVKNILPQLSKSKEQYQVITKLNTTTNKPNLFMIHALIGGSEVYTDLALKLSDRFSCYGVDPYNLYNEDTKDKRELAAYYLEQIDVIMQESKQESYNLLGWSFGGEIALEIALILESRPSNNYKINVFLLDTVLVDESMGKFLDYSSYVKHLKTLLVNNGYTDNYIEKFLTNKEIVGQLPQSGSYKEKLKRTKVSLVKALQPPEGVSATDSTWISYLNKQYSNIDLMVEEDNISLIEMDNAHHYNILEQNDKLVDILEKYMKGKTI